jgi:hypothetical protein
MGVGYDLTELQFDLENARVTAEIKLDPNFDDMLFTQYATKNCPTEIGFWMQMVVGYEKHFINTQYPLVEYVPKQEEQTYEI